MSTSTIVAVGAFVAAVHAFWTPATAAPLQPTSACEALRAADFSLVVDAPTRITEAKVARSRPDVAGHCEVRGYVAPSVGFLLLLPDAWNEKFMQVGCGGFCGHYIQAPDCKVRSAQTIAKFPP